MVKGISAVQNIPTNEVRIKICLIGRTRKQSRILARRLVWGHGFIRKQLTDGVEKFCRDFYKYYNYQRPVSYDKKLKFYDALYKIDPEIHVNRLIRRVDAGWSDVVVEDVRFKSEATKLKENGFTIIRVTSNENKRPVIYNFDESVSGLLTVSEWFDNDPNKIPADYSIHFENKVEATQTIDNLVRRLREIKEKNVKRN